MTGQSVRKYRDECPKTGWSQKSKRDKGSWVSLSEVWAEQIKYDSLRALHSDSIMDPPAEQADDSARESQGPDWAEG